MEPWLTCSNGSAPLTRGKLPMRFTEKCVGDVELGPADFAGFKGSIEELSRLADEEFTLFNFVFTWGFSEDNKRCFFINARSYWFRLIL